MVKESNRVLNGEYLMIMRGTFDRLVMERLSDPTLLTIVPQQLAQRRVPLILVCPCREQHVGMVGHAGA